MNLIFAFLRGLVADIYFNLIRFNYIHMIEKILTALIILIFAKIAQKLSYWILERVFDSRRKIYFDEKRAITLKAITKSIVRYSIYFFAFYFIISLFTTKTGAILTGAGIVGLAVGFGAQNLVRDVITGFFILLENQFAVGEYIKIGKYQGIVEELGLRVTKLRDWGGELHIIPNGQIKEVTNYNRGNMRALVEVGIAFEKDTDKAIELMKAVSSEVAKDMSRVIIEGPEVVGVVALNQTEVVIRVIARTEPMEQWAVERELRLRIKSAFDKEGIELPRSILKEPSEKDNIRKPESFHDQGEPNVSE